MKPTNFTAWLEGFLDATSSTKADINKQELEIIKNKLNEVDMNIESNTLSSKFCHSLQGVFEIENPSSFSDIQVEKIKNKLTDANAGSVEPKSNPLPLIPPTTYIVGGKNKYRC